MYQLWHISAVSWAANGSRAVHKCLKKYSAYNFRQASLVRGLQTLPLDGVTLCPVELFAPLFWFVSLTMGVAMALNVHNFLRAWSGQEDQAAAQNPRLLQITWINLQTVRLVMICLMFVAQLAMLAGLGTVRPRLMDPWLVVQAFGIVSTLLLWLFELREGLKTANLSDVPAVAQFALPHVIRAGTFIWAVQYWLIVVSLRRTLDALCQRGMVFSSPGAQVRGR